MAFGDPGNEPPDGFRGGFVYAKGGTFIRGVVTLPVFPGRDSFVNILKGGMSFDFGETLGGRPSFLEGIGEHIVLRLRHSYPMF